MKAILENIANRLVEEAGEKAIVGTYKAGESSAKIVTVAHASRKFRNKLFKLCGQNQSKEDE
jgi:hypothetical protein